MNKAEAHAILAEGLAKLRKLSYGELKTRIDTVDTQEVTGPSGAWYQLEYQTVWDGEAEGNIRVLGSIDDGGVRAWFPMSDSFIKSPDDSFVDE